MDLKIDADAVRGLGKDVGRVADSLLAEARGAEASLSQVSSGTDQKGVHAAVDELLQTLKGVHTGVLHGLRGFGTELQMTADAVEEADDQLATKVPTDS